MVKYISVQILTDIYFLPHRADCFDEETRLKRCAEDLKKKLHELNEVIKNDVQNHLNAAVENTIAGIRYFRVQSDGPRLKEISEKHPLVPRYINFNVYIQTLRLIKVSQYL